MFRRRKRDEYGKVDFARDKKKRQISMRLVKIAAIGVIAVISVLLFVNIMLPSFMNAVNTTKTFEVGGREYDPSLRLKEKKNYSHAVAALSTKVKYIGDVYMYGDEVIYGTVATSASNSQITGLYVCNISSGKTTQVSVSLKKTDILENKLNEKYIVYLDSDRNMGSIIKAINRKTGNTFTVKECGASNPALSLYDKYLVWIERTGTNKDKIFLYDLETEENSTIYMFDNSDQYAFSRPDIDENTIVFAAASKKNEANSAIYSIYIGAKETTPYVYETDTYVHNPKTNGRQAVWIDTNGSVDSNLYYTADVRNNDSRPVLIGSGVANYDIGDTFVAYNKGGSIYLYFFEDQEIYKLLPENEYGVLTSVEGNTITWLNTTYTTRTRDEIKYLVIK